MRIRSCADCARRARGMCAAAERGDLARIAPRPPESCRPVGCIHAASVRALGSYGTPVGLASIRFGRDCDPFATHACLHRNDPSRRPRARAPRRPRVRAGGRRRGAGGRARRRPRRRVERRAHVEHAHESRRSGVGAASRAKHCRGSRGSRTCSPNSAEDERDPAKPWLLAPCDLQAIKAAGVTFVASMLERVIEEQARGDPAKAESVRACDRRGDRRQPVERQARARPKRRASRTR